LYSLLDLTLLEQTGIPIKGFMTVTWYLSAMVIAMAIIYPLMKKYKEKFSCLYGLLAAVIGFGILMHVVPSIRTYDKWNGIMYNGMARALIEITLGTTIYEINRKLSKINISRFGSILLTIIQVLIFGFVIVFNSIYANAHYFDWLIIPLLFIGVLIGFSEKTRFNSWCNNKVFYYLEKLSLTIYLNNFLFIRMFNNSMFNDLSMLYKWIGAIILTTIFSMIELFIIEKIKLLMIKIMPKIKEKIIST
jgi:peptidoglycan/LPS O-acetylase OafA/YrhL